MQLNAGLFRANGGCGYIIKPPESRYGDDDDAAPWDEEGGAVTVLRMRLIIGELLPLPGERRHEVSAARQFGLCRELRPFDSSEL